MCKVAMVSGIKKENTDKVWNFMRLLGEQISIGNHHGLGYAAFDRSGNIFGERWLENKSAFLLPEKRIRLLNNKKDYNYFGDKVVRDDAMAIILHTRFATTAYGMLNVHPFVDDKDKPSFALIHNGMIYNHDELTKKHSTCDSEVILHEYIESEANKDMVNIQKVADQIEGWYTCGVLAKDKKDRPFVDIFTESGRLSSFYLPELECRIYSSASTDIYNVAMSMGYRPIKGFSHPTGSYKRLCAETGNTIKNTGFDPDKKFVDMSGNYSEEFWANLFERFSGS